jgi:hypothetical protein
MNKQIRFLLLGIAMAFIGACATPQTGGVPAGNPGDLVRQLDADLTRARSNQVDVLAPGLFNDAQSAFMKAKQGLG